MIICLNFLRYVSIYKIGIWYAGMGYGPQHQEIFNSIKFYGNVCVYAHTYNVFIMLYETVQF